MSLKRLQLIVAATEGLGIGVNGGLPWRIKRDMKFFREKTMGTVDPSKQNAVIMGRKSWESIPQKFRPLTGRLNIVISSQPAYHHTAQLPADVIVSKSFQEAVETARGRADVETVFVIGGATVYAAALESGETETILLTRVLNKDIHCDTHLPQFSHETFRLDETQSSPVYDEDGIQFQFVTYKNQQTQ